MVTGDGQPPDAPARPRQKPVPISELEALPPEPVTRNFDHDEKVARLAVYVDNNEFARQFARDVARIFYCVNGAVLCFVLLVWAVDTFYGPRVPGPSVAPRPPIITDRTVMALIAASAAQLGVLAVSVGRSIARIIEPDAGRR